MSILCLYIKSRILWWWVQTTIKLNLKLHLYLRKERFQLVLDRIQKSSECPLSHWHIVQRKNNFHLLPHQGNHTCVFDIRIDFHKTMLNRSFTIFVFFFFEGIASLTRMPRLERMWSLQMLKWVYPICAQKSIDALGNFLATQNTISFLSTPICLLNALISQGVQEADRPNEGFYIRSGITVILKNATINDGTVI